MKIYKVLFYSLFWLVIGTIILIETDWIHRIILLSYIAVIALLSKIKHKKIGWFLIIFVSLILFILGGVIQW